MQLDAPIFIVGPGRSGTTLLRSLLSAHTRLSIAPETQFMGWVSEREDLQGSPEDFEAFWDEYTSWVRFEDLAVDPDRCRELIEQQGTYTFESIFRAVLLAYQERTEADRVGEKSPSHVHYLPLLLDWFPTARVLVMQRDPRAVIASQLQTPYVRDQIKPLSLRKGLLANKRLGQLIYFADEWTEIFGVTVPRWQSDPRVRTVSYEALVQDPEGELQSVCSFLDETYEPAMVTERTSDTVHMPAGVTPDEQLEEWRREHYDKTLDRITSDSLDKWKTRLTKAEVAIIEGRCLQAMRATGYTPSIPPAQRLKGKVLSHLFAVGEKSEETARKAAKGARRRLRKTLA